MSDSEDEGSCFYFQYNGLLKCCKADDVSPRNLQLLFNLEYLVEHVEAKNQKIIRNCVFK